MIQYKFPLCATMATWIQYPQWVLIYLCIHIHIYTKAGFLGIKLRTVIRDRAGVIKINTFLASCKQTSAFPRELPRMRLWELKWCAKSSLFIPASRGNQEQAQSQNYRSGIWISDLSPHSAPGIGLVSSIVWDISVTSEISTNPTFVPLDRRKCGCHGNWQGLGGSAAWNEQVVTTLHCLVWADYQNPIEYGLRVTMQLYWTYFHGILDMSLIVTYSIKMSEEKKNMLQPILLSGIKEHQIEMNQGNWVPNVKVTSSQQTYSSSCVIWVTLGRMTPCDGSWFPTCWSK